MSVIDRYRRASDVRVEGFQAERVNATAVRSLVAPVTAALA
jgi:hypothetical protein